MGFLVPLFLAGLAALAVPVLVHLRHRERNAPVRFPSLMFLRRVPFREVARQQIHHWPLFLLRCLAVALLAFAFARPYLRDRGQVGAIAARTGQDLVVVLDRSASMGYGDRWARGQAAALEALRGLDGSDRGAVVLFDAAAEVAVPLTGDRARLLAAVETARPGSRATRLAGALRAARELLTGSDRPRLQVMVISDFQRSGWQGEAFDPLPEGTVLRQVHLGEGPAPNVSLAGVDLASEGGGRLAVTTTVRSTGAGDAPHRVRLELDGRPAGTREVAAGDGARPVTFAGIAPGPGTARGTIRLDRGDALPADDLLHFVPPPDRPVRVLVVRGGRDAARAFLERALAISRRPRVEIVSRPAVTEDALRAADVVVLDDAPIPGGAAGRRLVEFVRAGGGLVQVLGPVTGAGGAWPEGLPAFTTGAVVDRDGSAGGGAGTIGTLRREHPVFEPFRGPRSGDFSATRVFRYRAVTADSLDVLARYDDGAPALLEGTAGSGRVLVLTSALDNLWTDLPLQPVFLPLAHRMVLHAARYVDRPPAYLVGEVATVGPDLLGGTDAVVVESPSGRRLRREVTAGPVSFPLDEAGFHEVREARSGGRLLAVVAANVAPEESELAPFDADDLTVAAGARDSAAAAVDPLAAGLATAVERERVQGIWWYLLGVVVLLLAGETMLANRAGGPARIETPSPGDAS